MEKEEVLVMFEQFEQAACKVDEVEFRSAKDTCKK